MTLSWSAAPALRPFAARKAILPAVTSPRDHAAAPSPKCDLSGKARLLAFLSHPPTLPVTKPRREAA